MHKLRNVAKVPFMMITGSASIHATYDWCFPAFLNQAGVETEWILLEELGILGNGHFMMVERNSGEIAGVVEGWIQGLEEGGR